MATYKLIYFPCKARGELIRLIFVQAGVEYENNRLGFFPLGSAEWVSMKKSKFLTNAICCFAKYHLAIMLRTVLNMLLIIIACIMHCMCTNGAYSVEP